MLEAFELIVPGHLTDVRSFDQRDMAVDVIFYRSVS